MERLTSKKLNKILGNHKHWINEDVDGWENMQADLFGANLYIANLSNTNLRYADLSKANLCVANLIEADLSSADLSWANLYNSNLYHTNLSYANLSYANLSYADLRDAKNIPFISYACLEVGEFIGFKKAHSFIVVLKILEDSRRLSATTRKCRCDKALVMEIQNLDGTKADVEEVSSNYDSKFVYKVGEIVSVNDFDKDRWGECSTGIHFFINRQEAVDY